MRDVWQKLSECDRPVFIYGTGNGADKLIDKLNELNIKISGVFASDGFVRERSFRGFKVVSLAYVIENFEDPIALLSFGTSRSETIEYIKEVSKEITLLMPEVPVCGTEVFDLEFAKKNKAELEKVYNLLCDEESKKTFYNLVMFKLTGELNYLFNCESDEKYEFSELLKLKSTDNYLDLGAYNGDTVLSFRERVKGGKIVAVEPDKKTFKKLVLNTQNHNVTAINAAVSNQCGEVLFKSGSGRGSSVGTGESINSVTVDYLSQEENFDYIKFDIEGAELSAILGAKNTITEKKPKMLISCYHKSSDYFEIPLKVLEFNKEYKIYMRHFPSIPAWDTCFYFV